MGFQQRRCLVPENVSLTYLDPGPDGQTVTVLTPAALNLGQVRGWTQVLVAGVKRLKIGVVGEGDLAHPTGDGRLAGSRHLRFAITGEAGVDVIILLVIHLYVYRLAKHAVRSLHQHLAQSGVSVHAARNLLRRQFPVMG